jgi:hypothetical protein
MASLAELAAFASSAMCIESIRKQTWMHVKIESGENSDLVSSARFHAWYMQVRPQVSYCVYEFLKTKGSTSAALCLLDSLF